MAEQRKPRTPPSHYTPSPTANSVTTAITPAKQGKAKAIIVPSNGFAPVTRKLITLDDRKLTGKDKARLSVWEGERRGQMVAGMLAKQIEDIRKEVGGGKGAVLMGKDTGALIIGIPCPALAFEYVIAQDCFPLGLVLQLVALAGTGKSAMLAEFYRWFDMAGGGGVFCENESKFNPQWYQSIMREAYDRLQYHKCRSVEDWQRHLSASSSALKRDMLGTKKEPGPGKTIPILMGIDSIMGRQSEATQEQILGALTEAGLRGTTGEGHASRGFPIEALIITRYMRTFPQELDFWPFSLVLVNHLKMDKSENNTPERVKGGGKLIDFQESFELELTKLGGPKKKIACAEWEGYPVKLSCHKNSFGPGNREVQTRLIWYYLTNEDGTFTQQTAWDWDWSTVWLLNHILRGDKPDVQLKANLKEIDFHLECPDVGEVINSAWSKDLGMKESDKLPWSDVGALIREDKILLDRLRTALRINRRPRLAGDYLKQKDDLAKEQP